MATEIEHKYLVADSSYRSMATKVFSIRQGYLSREPERTVRVRTIDENAFLTVKGKTFGDSRLEFEYRIPFADALKLLELCLPGIIEKKRFIVPFEGFIWEIDEFEGAKKGLVVAEIEIPSSDTVYPLPSFLGKEVTGDPSYYNSNL